MPRNAKTKIGYNSICYRDEKRMRASKRQILPTSTTRIRKKIPGRLRKLVIEDIRISGFVKDREKSSHANPRILDASSAVW